MRFYLKEYPDGVEYSPVGRQVDRAKLDAGFKIVDAIPQRIRDKESGGKDYVPLEDPQEAKLRGLEERIRYMEEVILQRQQNERLAKISTPDPT